MRSAAQQERDALRPAVDDVPLWYHTLELRDSVTPGWFDLRPIVGKLPWPKVEGMRCLDVGTYDGFYAFELERRGAREVVATDIPAHRDWDLPEQARDHAAVVLEAIAGEKGLGFEAARTALGSSVQKQLINVYELSPETIGTFDVVVCGSLLLHLRDPLRALEAIRSVCKGWFMSIETISLGLSLRFRRRAVAEMRMDPELAQWWVTNVAGHARMVEVAGFDVVQRAGPFSVPFGAGHPPRPRDPAAVVRRLARRAVSGGEGVPHGALLARARG